MPLGPGPRIGETLRLGTSPTREGPPVVECSRCFKIVYPDELELLTEKDTHGFYPSGIHVCKQCHKEVKNMAQEKLHEKEAVQSSTD